MAGTYVKPGVSDLSFLDYFIVYEYAAAVFTDNDLLPRFDIELSLRWYLVEASTACITLNGNDSQTVSCI
jgi:hypothetical protein